jgi:hypothetical protein
MTLRLCSPNRRIRRSSLKISSSSLIRLPQPISHKDKPTAATTSRLNQPPSPETRAAGGPSSDYAFCTFTRLRGQVRVIGAEVLSGCKDPQKQFDLVADHIRRIRLNHRWVKSRIVVYVERNLGHEAEHHRHGLKDIAGVFFREDPKSGRVGLLTTNDIKHGMATLMVPHQTIPLTTKQSH